jgi:hypothetical protein
MNYTVGWKRPAENLVTQLWLSGNSQERQDIRRICDGLDALLGVRPRDVGELREGNVRVLNVPPLSITFEVNDDDRMVVVLAVRKLPE